MSFSAWIMTEARKMAKLPTLTHPTVVSLFEMSGRMVEPWLEAGYDAVTIDLLNADSAERVGQGTLHRLNLDLSDEAVQQELVRWAKWNRKHVAMVFGFPPCTHLANSGARWFGAKSQRASTEGRKDPWDASMEMVDLVRQVGEGAGAPWMVENPVGRISTHPRYPHYSKPRFWFHPHQFAGWLDGEEDSERYSKKTGIWGSQDILMPDEKDLGKHADPRIGTKIHWMPPVHKGRPRSYWRSLTPQGFARAFFAKHHRPGSFGTQY
jgi:hypothetical protein